MDTKYRHVADQLIAAIDRGEYPVGSTLPPLRELMTRFGVARGTARAAVALLVGEGLAVVKQGVGTLVCGTARGTRPAAPERVARPQLEVVVSGWTGVGADVAARLGLSSGSLAVHRVRHHRQGTRVVQIDQQWVPAGVAGRIERNTGQDIADRETTPHTHLTDLMRRAGLNPVIAAVTMTARMPEQGECATMRIPANRPVLVAYHVVHDSSGRPVETTTTVASADKPTPMFTIPMN
ncbi:GntR family transcriptional regulator [Actinokineospora sp. HUAS TT18]|uniref:GntR family transcriptional regulator n=1 Tax=Actinokineospora sp. HUAS TT18 TaxID=3447451 RepID=UPI003F51CD81